VWTLFRGDFVPGLVLFVVVGGALALAAVMVFRGHPLARAVACEVAPRLKRHERRESVLTKAAMEAPT
jgi:hypothetical protein